MSKDKEKDCEQPIPQLRVVEFGSGQAGITNEQEEVVALMLPTESGEDCRRTARIMAVAHLLKALLKEASVMRANNAGPKQWAGYERRCAKVYDYIEFGYILPENQGPVEGEAA